MEDISSTSQDDSDQEQVNGLPPYQLLNQRCIQLSRQVAQTQEILIRSISHLREETLNLQADFMKTITSLKKSLKKISKSQRSSRRRQQCCRSQKSRAHLKNIQTIKMMEKNDKAQVAQNGQLQQ